MVGGGVLTRRFGPPPGYWDGIRRVYCKEMGVTATQIQDRRNPLERMLARTENGCPSTADSFVDSSSGGDGSVEAAGKRQSGGVGDCELHRGDRADPVTNERRSSTGKDIMSPGLSRRARIEDHQAGTWTRLAEEDGELASPHEVPATVSANHVEDPLVPRRVESPVTNKVDHVPGPVLERILDVVPGPSWCPLQLDPSVRQRLRQRVSEPPSFLFDVQFGEIVGTGDDPEDPQRSGNTQRIDRRRNREMADERLKSADVLVPLGVKHRFPGERCQLGGAEIQHDPERITS